MADINKDDPNVMNELGHTHYPKWVEHDGKRVIVKNEDEEFELTGEVKNPISAKYKKKVADWGKGDKKP